MTNDLLLAILSMDAYNRGSNPGLRVNATSIGGATVGDFSQIDSTGFFAQAYNLGTQNIISYRGTDDNLDPFTDWPTGGGAYTNAQALEAAQFYSSRLSPEAAQAT